nr:helix-turn-helix transcriptional regulator [Sedimentibacter sp.]
MSQRGIKIKKRLVEKSMTQRELAEKIKMKEQYLTDILSGRRSGNKYINQIYQELGLNMEDEDDFYYDSN